MKLNRQIIKVSKIESDKKEPPAQITMAEGISFLWELTEEIFSLSGKYDVKSRLQRHVVSITRQQS